MVGGGVEVEHGTARVRLAAAWLAVRHNIDDVLMYSMPGRARGTGVAASSRLGTC